MALINFLSSLKSFCCLLSKTKVNRLRFLCSHDQPSLGLNNDSVLVLCQLNFVLIGILLAASKLTHHPVVLFVLDFLDVLLPSQLFGSLSFFDLKVVTLLHDASCACDAN